MTGSTPTEIAVLAASAMGWPSMREVLPALEKVWEALGSDRRYRVHILKYHSRLTLKRLRCLERADLLVVMKASHLECLRLLRKRFGINTPCFLHTYGEGVDGGASTMRRLVDHLDNPGDVLLAASAAQAAALRTCLPNATVRVLPFPVLSLYPRVFSEAARRKNGRAPFRRPRPLVYVGRISEQKNLHVFLLALWILNREFPELSWTAEFYGGPDGLGSTAMGFRMKRYGEYLKDLASRLGIKHLVRWRGFVSVRRLDREVLRRPHIFVSPSLHSDEDFGVAALKSLALGNHAVLSAWGGHKDFARRFPRQVLQVSPLASELGPYIPAVEFAERLAQAVRRRRGHVVVGGSQIRPYTVFGSKTLLEGFVRSRCRRQEVRLKVSAAMRRTSRRLPGSHTFLFRNPLFTARDGARAFTSYRDPRATPFFKAYGMKTKVPKPATGPEKGRLILTPWTRLRGDQIVVSDPHRGPYLVSMKKLRREDETSVPIFDVFGKRHNIAGSSGRWLIQNGLASNLEMRSVKRTNR
jgi:glycosyltransferase involved in cell wall biosynthesis